MNKFTIPTNEWIEYRTVKQMTTIGVRVSFQFLIGEWFKTKLVGLQRMAPQLVLLPGAYELRYA